MMQKTIWMQNFKGTDGLWECGYEISCPIKAGNFLMNGESLELFIASRTLRSDPQTQEGISINLHLNPASGMKERSCN
jgi:hypothetical protein